MRARVLGLGWVTPGGWGRGGSGAGYGFPAAPLPELARKVLFTEPYPRYGRLDGFSRLGLAGIALALGDAGLDRWEEKRPVGIVAGSRCGCLATDLDYFRDVLPEGGGLASPNLFAYTLPNTMLGEAAIRFGLTGPGYVLGSGAAASLAPVEVALETLAAGAASAMLAGFCELPPAGFAPPEAPPGTTFLVLAAASATTNAPELQLDDRLRVGGTVVATWSELVAACRRG